MNCFNFIIASIIGSGINGNAIAAVGFVKDPAGIASIIGSGINGNHSRGS